MIDEITLDTIILHAQKVQKEKDETSELLACERVKNIKLEAELRHLKASRDDLLKAIINHDNICPNDGILSETIQRSQTLFTSALKNNK